MTTEESGTSADPNFEAALARLQEIVEQIEAGAIDLDESLALFEEGVRMLRRAERQLGRVETRVQQLLEENGQIRLREMGEE